MRVIMDVQATTAVRQAEVTAARTQMIARTAERFDAWPTRLAAGHRLWLGREMLAWLVDERAD